MFDSMETTMKIPTEADWKYHPGDLDAAWAYKNFRGKTLAEADKLFVENAFYYQEDIMFMPKPCFCFYVQAYINYLFSEHSKGDSDAAHAFFGIVRIRKDDIRSGPQILRRRIRELLLHLGANQSWYEALIEIDGDFRAMTEEALTLISE